MFAIGSLRQFAERVNKTSRLARTLAQNSAVICLVGVIPMLATGSSIADHHPVLAAVPISRMDLSLWRQRFEAKEDELRRRDPELVFYGDSIFRNWERAGPQPWLDFAPVWQRFYGDRNAVNLGFIGDTTASLLWRIENGEATGIHPKVAVILIGANNFGRVHWSAEDTLQGIDAIVHELHRRLPETRLLLLSILPSDRSAWVTEMTLAANRALAQKYGHHTDVAFLDVTHVFMRDGRLDRDLYSDWKLDPPEPLLHPTAQAQMRLAQAIEPTLATLLGDRLHE